MVKFQESTEKASAKDLAIKEKVESFKEFTILKITKAWNKVWTSVLKIKLESRQKGTKKVIHHAG